MTFDSMVDELRLLYAEQRSHLDIIRHKRSREEIEIKRQRIATLEAIAKFLLENREAIESLFRHGVSE